MDQFFSLYVLLNFFTPFRSTFNDQLICEPNATIDESKIFFSSAETQKAGDVMLKYCSCRGKETKISEISLPI